MKESNTFTIIITEQWVIELCESFYRVNCPPKARQEVTVRVKIMYSK